MSWSGSAPRPWPTPELESADVNPLIVGPDGAPIAVDALVELGQGPAPAPAGARPRPTDEPVPCPVRAERVVVAGASSHPGKFGFVSVHNILASGYQGRVFGTNLQGEAVLGIQTMRDIDELPDGAADLVFVCTPASVNPSLLRACAAKGIKAAFITSAGYGEAGAAGKLAEQELVALADELGILLAGPNGQGVVSTPAKLCAQIVAPFPPAGGIGIASQSGNFVSSFQNLARQTGVGVSRAVSAGNAAAVGVADYLDWYADDDVDQGRPRLRRGHHRRTGPARPVRRGRRPQAARAPEGRGDRRRSPGRGEPHRRAGGRRQDLRRRLPAGRGHPGGQRRGGVRSGGDVRHPAVARTDRTSSWSPPSAGGA